MLRMGTKRLVELEARCGSARVGRRSGGGDELNAVVEDCEKGEKEYEVNNGWPGERGREEDEPSVMMQLSTLKMSRVSSVRASTEGKLSRLSRP